MPTTKEPEILRTLNADSCHVTEKEMDWLLEASQGYGPLKHKEFELYASSDEYYAQLLVDDAAGAVAAHLAMVGAPNIARLLALASEHDCWYLRIESGGGIYEDLPQFEW